MEIRESQLDLDTCVGVANQHYDTLQHAVGVNADLQEDLAKPYRNPWIIGPLTLALGVLAGVLVSK